MGYNYSFKGNSVTIDGFNGDKNLQGTIDLNILKAFKDLKEGAGILTDEDEAILLFLEDYIEIQEDEEEECEEEVK